MNGDRLKSSGLMKYGCLAAPVAFAGFPLYVLAPDFYATNYGISLGLIGVVLLVLRAFDAFQDPLIGYLSDKYRNSVSFVMAFAALILCASIYALFNHIYINELIWFSICMMFAVTSYSILSINLNALGALWVKDKDSQTRIATYREIFGLLGLVLAVSLPAILKENIAGDHVYVVFSAVLMLIMSFCLYMFFKWRSRNPAAFAKNRQTRQSIIKMFETLSKESRKLLLVYLISMLASSIPAVLVIFFVRDLLGAEQYTGLFLLLYFLSGAFFMNIWKNLSVRHGKYISWFMAMNLAVVSFVWAFFLNQGDIWQYAAICLISGVALGADLVLPPAILADNLHNSESSEAASTHYSTLAIAAKLSLALASFAALPLLDIYGFKPAADNNESSLLALSYAYALIPCGLKLISAFMLWRLFIYSKTGGNDENNDNIINISRGDSNV